VWQSDNSGCAVFRDGKQPCLRELAQMLTGGRSRDSRKPGQLAAGKRLPAHKCSQHSDARGVADERRDLDHVGGGNHAAFYRGGKSPGKQR
jgi:hypothetical protein